MSFWFSFSRHKILALRPRTCVCRPLRAEAITLQAMLFLPNVSKVVQDYLVLIESVFEVRLFFARG